MPRDAKPQRIDLNTAAPSNGEREYGAVKRDQDALDEMPLVEGPVPDSLGPLAAPTNRPEEPVTTGVPIGDGPGPEALMMNPQRRYQSPLERVAEATQNPRLLQMVRNLRV